MSQASDFERQISLFTATMLGVGAMIGAGIFVLSGIAAGHAGPAVVLAFLFNALVAFAIGACYAELGAAMPWAGGSYHWVQKALGRGAGFSVGWISLYANVVASALYALGFAAFLHALLQVAGFSFTFCGVNPEPITASLLSLLIAWIHFRGLKDLSLAENLITCLKILLLLVLVVGGLALVFAEPERMSSFEPFLPHGFSGVVIAMSLIFVAFEGFEVITRTGEEIIEPERNIPRAIFLSIAISVSLYLLIAFVLITAVSTEEGLTSWAYLSQLGELGMAKMSEQLMPNGEIVFYIAGMASTFSAMIAASFSAVRVTFALGRTRDLPKKLSRIHAIHKSPHIAIALCFALVVLMVNTLPIVEVAGAASQMFALLFAMVCFSCWRLRVTQPDMYRPFRAPAVSLLAFMGVLMALIVLAALWNLSLIAWLCSFVWLFLGFVLFRYRRNFHQKSE